MRRATTGIMSIPVGIGCIARHAGGRVKGGVMRSAAMAKYPIQNIGAGRARGIMECGDGCSIEAVYRNRKRGNFKN